MLTFTVQVITKMLILFYFLPLMDVAGGCVL